jgi:hypothetical protein
MVVVVGKDVGRIPERLLCRSIGRYFGDVLLRMWGLEEA